MWVSYQNCLAWVFQVLDLEVVCDAGAGAVHSSFLFCCQPSGRRAVSVMSLSGKQGASMNV